VEGRHAGTSNATIVPEVLQDIVGNIEEIIRSEFRLAEAELSEKRPTPPSPPILSGSAWSSVFMDLVSCR
jgi:hypothetical protein